MEEKKKEKLYPYFETALKEDVADADHTTLACLAEETIFGQGVLKAKENMMIAGVEIATTLFHWYDSDIQVSIKKHDGDVVKSGERILEAKGSFQKLLLLERTMLNIFQRMSGIATLTNQFVQKLSGTSTQLLDSRKTTPNFRIFEKEAFKIGGGKNHRMGLYDAILIKDNHIDAIGSAEQCLEKVNRYLQNKKLSLPIIVEARNYQEAKHILASKYMPHRILLDNFLLDDILEVKQKITSKNLPVELEVSGGVSLQNIKRYAKANVEYISTGHPIHQAKSKNLNFKISMIRPVFG